MKFHLVVHSQSEQSQENIVDTTTDYGYKKSKTSSTPETSLHARDKAVYSPCLGLLRYMKNAK